MKELTEEQLKEAADELDMPIEEVMLMYKRAISMGQSRGMKEALKATGADKITQAVKPSGLAKVTQVLKAGIAGGVPNGRYTKAGRAQRSEGRVTSEASESVADTGISAEEFQQMVTEMGYKQAIRALMGRGVKPGQTQQALKAISEDDRKLWDKLATIQRLPSWAARQALSEMTAMEKAELLNFMNDAMRWMGMKEMSAQEQQQLALAENFKQVAASWEREGQLGAANLAYNLSQAMARNVAVKQADQPAGGRVPTPAQWLNNQVTSKELNPSHSGSQPAEPLMTTDEMIAQATRKQRDTAMYAAFTSQRMNKPANDKRSKTDQPYDLFTSKRLNGNLA